MNSLPWFERNLKFGYPIQMLPYFLERLDGTFVRLEAKVKSVPNEILSQQLNGKWSVKQNIGHLAEVDEINFKRIDEMIAGVAQLSPAVFEPRKDYNGQDVKDVLHYFHKTRLKNIKRYSSLTDLELTKSSLHPRLNVQMTPVDLAWFDAEHDDHHLVTINNILKSLAS
jgi:uncharacterized damage-inducible protein DinB